ncbi:hypothetical protein BH09GEM1_BH09GEM1_40470 [soil metagenome]
MTHRRMRTGFTLIELLVVLVLLAITASAAVPALLGDAARSPEQRVASALADALIATRETARESGATATLTLSPSDGRFWVTTRDSSSTSVLPMAGGVTIVGDNTERIVLRFDPTGPTTATAITVRGARALTVRSSAFTGDITIDDGRAH